MTPLCSQSLSQIRDIGSRLVSSSNCSAVRCNFWSRLKILVTSITPLSTDPLRNSLQRPSQDTALRHHLRHCRQLLHHLRHKQTLLNPVPGRTLENLIPSALQDWSLLEILVTSKKSRAAHQTSQNWAPDGVAVALVPVRPTSPPRRLAFIAHAMRVPRRGTTRPLGAMQPAMPLNTMVRRASISTQAK